MEKRVATVVMNPKTGEILGMVSYPDFNIQNIDSDYSAIVERNNGAFLIMQFKGDMLRVLFLR